MNLFEWLESSNQDTLTIQDALLTVAVSAAKIGSEESQDRVKQIVALAQTHPLFFDARDTVEARVNNLVHLILDTDPEKATGLAAGSLTQELRETAFEWATRMTTDNGSLSKDEEVFLEKLIIQLGIDITDAKRIFQDALYYGEIK